MLSSLSQAPMYARVVWAFLRTLMTPFTASKVTWFDCLIVKAFDIAAAR